MSAPALFSRAPDTLVVGGGVIGAAIAWRLARRGHSVALVEASSIAAGASGAAAGMLAAQAEQPHPGALFDAGLLSRRLLLEWREELEGSSGIGLDLVATGLLRVASGDEEERELHRRVAWQSAAGAPARWLDAAALRELEPGLAPSLLGGAFFPADSQLEAPRLARAYALAAAGEGAFLAEGLPAAGLLREGRRVTGLLLADGRRQPAGRVVLAAGHAAARLWPPLGERLALHPVRGQILALRPFPGTAPRHTIFASTGYLVPKPDGRLLVGSVEEEGEWQARTRLDVLDRLARAAVELVPALASAEPVAAWAGLRPKLGDGLPVLGFWPGADGLYVAAGHFRNGILLSALSGEAAALDLLGEELPPELGHAVAAFRPEARELPGAGSPSSTD
ncbi:MAG: glycine oxidase ThiO [Bacillota bacterium]|nr:glycine oxidase ThiO [Bacillota bacterium]